MNAWQAFLKWGDSALVSLAGIASAPGVLPVIVHAFPVLGPWVPIIFAVLGVLHITVLPEASTNLPPPSAQARTSVLVLILLALPVATWLTGCSFLESGAGTTIELAAVDSAIAIAEQKGVSAATINAVAHLAQTGDTVASGILAGILTKASPSMTEAQAALAAAIAEAIKVTGG